MCRLLIICVLILGSQTLYSQFVPPRQGSIENSRGEQCEFITNVTTQSYFTETPQRIFIHTFQNYHYGKQFLFIDFEYSKNQQYILRFMYTISEGVTY